MKLIKKNFLLVSFIFACVLCTSCKSCASSENIEKAESALKKANYAKSLKYITIPELEDFKEWALNHFKYGSDARLPAKNKAELAEEDKILEYENKKMFLMLQSMYKIKDSRFFEYLLVWYEYFTITQYHADFETQFLKSTNSELIVLPSKLNAIIEFRTTCYKNKWSDAYKLLIKNFPDISEDSFFEDKPPAFINDVGKSFYYGKTNLIEDAKRFSNVASLYALGSINNFLCHFYSGRIFSKCETNDFSLTLREFKFAMNNTKNPALYDHALWYYLTTCKKKSTRSALNATLEYASTWKDLVWYDDFLDDLGTSLLRERDWDTFYSTYKFLLPYASDETNSKFSYIAGRLLQEKLTKTSEADIVGATKKAFSSAWNASDGQLYYRLMAAMQLSISPEQIFDTIKERTVNWKIVNDDKIVKQIEQLEKQHKYNAVLDTYSLNKFTISTKQAIAIGHQLEDATGSELNWYPEALRVFVAALSVTDNSITKEQFSLIYPQYYSTFVSDYSKEYDFPEYYLYALIRSESFFDTHIVSYADAVGLTQLLPTTAADMARKLHINDYDITKPHDNIQLGTYYLQELHERLDNSYIQAFFSYNGGITRVRRWKKEWADLPSDLFLEVLPYAETREYGRKTAVAAAMYGALYYNKSTTEVLSELFEK